METIRHGLRSICLLLLACLAISVLPAETKAATPEANEKKVYTYLTENMGLSTAAACGIMANISLESGFYADINGLGGAYGLCQWAGQRRTNLVSYCSKHNLKYNTAEGQMAFLEYELKKDLTGLLANMKKVPNTSAGAYAAGYDWCYEFERPANKASVSIYRGNVASNTFWKKYSKAGKLSESNLKKISACTITLPQTSYVYNGKYKKPALTIMDGTKMLTHKTDYTVSYKNNRSAGTATITVKGIGDYTGTVTKQFTITKAPQTITVGKTAFKFVTTAVDLRIKSKGRITLVSSDKTIAAVSKTKLKLKKAGTVTITIKAAGTSNYQPAVKTVRITIKPTQPVASVKKNLSGGTAYLKVTSKSVPEGYEVQYTDAAKFTSASTVTAELEGGKTAEVRFSGLKLKTTYRFRVRGWVTIDGKKVYSSWSTVYKIRIKK